MNVFDLSAKIAMDINGYLKGMDTAKAVAISTLSVIGSAVSDFMQSSIEVGKGFDKSMSQVAATMGMSVADMHDPTTQASKDFEALSEFAQTMGRTTAFTARQAADALNYMALAGYSVEKSMNTLPSVLTLAAAGNMDLARASDVVTDVETAFGNSTKRTTQMIDEMAKTASISNTSVEQLGDAFLVVGGLVQELNGGFIELADGTKAEVDGVQELEIALGAMANAGVKGSEAGTHMRNMLLKLSSPTAEGTKRLEAMGVAVFDAEGNMRSLSDVFGDLNVSLETMTQKDRIQAISDLFNTRDLASAEALLNAVGQDWDKIGAKILDAKGAGDEMAKVQMDNLAGDMTYFQSAVEGAQIAMSDGATPALRKLTQFGTAAVTDLTNAFKGLPPEIQSTVSMIGLIGGKALEVIPQVMSLITTVLELKAAKTLAGLSNTTEGIEQLGQKGSSTGKIIAGVTAGLFAFGTAVTIAGEEVKRQNQATVDAGAAYEIDLAGGIEAARKNFDEFIKVSGDATLAQEAMTDASAKQKEALEAFNTANADYTDFLVKYPAMSKGVVKAGDSIMDSEGHTVTVTKDLVQQYQSLQKRVNESRTALDNANGLVKDTTRYMDELGENTEATAGIFDDAGNTITDFATKVKKSVEYIPRTTKTAMLTVAEAVSGMKTSLTDSAKSITNWFDEVEKQEKLSADELAQNLSDQIESMKNWENNLQYLSDKGINQELLKYLADMGPKGANYVQAFVDAANGETEVGLDEMNRLWAEKLQLEEAVNSEAEGVLHSVGVMAAGSENALADLAVAAAKYGRQLPEGVAEAIIASTPDATLAAKALRNAAISFDLYGPGYDIGTNMVLGVVRGINANADSAVNAAAAMSNRTISKTRAIMAIQSPSKVFEEIGRYIDMGLAQGIDKYVDLPVDSAEALSNDVINSMDVGTYNYGAGFGGESDAYDYTEEIPQSGSPVNVTMNIYGAEGQDVQELATIISQELALRLQAEEKTWA